jgi:hypothetical protein
MTVKPAYFDRIRQGSAKRWQQLEQDPELAGPWHQLFKQVQSPRHVLSELLQNADDADACRATVRIDDGVFTFSHDGVDFTEEHFASLCRFGYSNKRALHTIGFRGIGFKSTFSLGDRVELFTPTLCVEFEKERFTLPSWRDNGNVCDGLTRVRVQSVERRRQKELEKNFSEWLTSSKSLLFFRNLRRIEIGENTIHWRKQKNGPVSGSEWVALESAPDELFLHIRSSEEPFPDEALEEIRQERLLAMDEKADFPPCRVEIVLNSGGRLYVVLPTGVETDLPFACNAPFIQDPARLKIKDPDISPTNRWLLARCGRLAAETMMNWLGNGKLSLSNRAAAYALVPETPIDSSALEDSCAAIVAEAFGEAIEERRVLLTEDGTLVAAGKSLAIPCELLDIWSREQTMALLDERERPPLCREIQSAHRDRLIEWKLVDEIDRLAFVKTLSEKRIPKPGTWHQLLQLWAFVAPEVTGYHRHGINAENLQLVPTQGKRYLEPATNVVRLGEKKLLQSEEDWEFLSQHLLVLNQNWTRFLAEKQRLAEETDEQPLGAWVAEALALLDDMRLAEASNVDEVLATVAAQFFGKGTTDSGAAVRLTQIAAKLGVAVDEEFNFRTRDEVFRSTKDSILFDADGTLESLLPDTMRESKLLHKDYTRRFQSCTGEEWDKWVTSGRASLRTFVPFVGKVLQPGRRRKLDEELERRGYEGPVEPRFKDPWFFIDDWDFDKALWDHWTEMEAEAPNLWGVIVERLISERDSFWSKHAAARVGESSRNNSESYLRIQGLRPAWVMSLRDKPCLPDTRGFFHKPADLLRRTPETESLLDVETFVHGRLDNERNRALLDLLGVQSTPTGPDRLLERLFALSKAKNAPVREVEKWYLRLDQMLETCSTDDATSIRKAFRTKKLILTEDGSWADAKGVFLYASEDDAPGAAVVRSSVNDLTLWMKVGVAERPTVELALEWLKALPSGKALSQEDARRVRNLLARHPIRLFEECEHWLSLAGTWEPVSSLRFAVTMQSLTPWQHLHEWVKKQTANLRDLQVEVTANPPFSILPPLAGAVEERFSIPPANAHSPEHKPWLATFGAELARVELDSEDETSRVRTLAARAAKTRWHRIAGVEVVPYIGGKPAGTARAVDVAWMDDALYVGSLNKAKLARRVPEELGKVFGRADIKAALDYSFERAPEDVREYLAENFTLAARPEKPVEAHLPEEAADEGQTEATLRSVDDERNSDADASDVYAAPIFSESIGGLRERPAPEDGQALGFDDDFLDIQPPPSSKPKTIKPPLMERFACSRGFRKVDSRQFVHDAGDAIGRVSDSPFPWEHRDVAGKILRWYWASEHCLARQPLQIDAEVWGLIEKYPGTYALVLTDLDGEPTEVTGVELVSMREAGSITLYPAAYRLVQTEDAAHA